MDGKRMPVPFSTKVRATPEVIDGDRHLQFPDGDYRSRRRIDCRRSIKLGQQPKCRREITEISWHLAWRTLRTRKGALMAAWLFKQEPSCYSWADLVRDKRTLWDGVSNALALKHLRQVKPGERVFFYHTGKEKAVVGEMRVVKVGTD